MKILKGLFICTALLLGLAVAVGIVLGAVMFFTDVKLFGYGVVRNLSVSKVTTTGETTALPSEIAVEVITKGFDVNITPKTYGEDTFVVTYYNNIVGLYKDSKNVYLKGSASVEKDSKYGCYSNPRYYIGENEITYNGTSYDGDTSLATKVVIELVEPEGYLQYGESRIDIYVPQNIVMSKLTVKTTSGDISIMKDTAQNETTPRYLSVESLDLTTTSGDVKTIDGIKTVADGSNYVVFDSMNITTGTGVCDLSNTNIIIGQQSSVNYSNLNVEISDIPVALKTNGGKLAFNELYGTVDIKGDNINVIAKAIYTGGKRLEINTTRGLVNVDYIYTTETSRQGITEATVENPSVAISGVNTNDTMVEIYTTYTSINSKYISGPLSVASNYGDINIETVQDYADITSEHGNVNIKKANDSFIIETTYGDVTVDSYEKGAAVFSSYGKITLTDTRTSSATTYKTIVKSQDGNVTLNNAYAGYEITGTGKANIKITMRESNAGSVSNAYVVNAKRGNIDLHFNGINMEYGISITPNAPKVNGMLLGTKIVAGQENLINTNSSANAIKYALTTVEGDINISGDINAVA